MKEMVLRVLKVFYENRKKLILVLVVMVVVGILLRKGGVWKNRSREKVVRAYIQVRRTPLSLKGGDLILLERAEVVKLLDSWRILFLENRSPYVLRTVAWPVGRSNQHLSFSIAPHNFAVLLAKREMRVKIVVVAWGKDLAGYFIVEKNSIVVTLSPLRKRTWVRLGDGKKILVGAEVWYEPTQRWIE